MLYTHFSYYSSWKLSSDLSYNIVCMFGSSDLTIIVIVFSCLKSLLSSKKMKGLNKTWTRCRSSLNACSKAFSWAVCNHLPPTIVLASRALEEPVQKVWKTPQNESPQTANFHKEGSFQKRGCSPRTELDLERCGYAIWGPDLNLGTGMAEFVGGSFVRKLKQVWNERFIR